MRTQNDNCKSNKDKIFITAIKLFAESGYSGVSMRNIATAVGIKASSIYNHYESKEAILEAIFDYYVQRLNETVYPSLELQAITNPKEYLRESLQTSMMLFKIPVMSDIIRIITREQFSNERIREFLLHEMILKPRKQFIRVFEKLIAENLIKPYPAEILAKEYQSFSISRYFENSLINTDLLNLERDQLEQEAHLDFFWNAIKKEEYSL
ncbi:MAG: transcriptional regulator, TetR family [Bacillota bacterium]|jgi:AcrR family transcriptional regulator|nr:transcriptional regulator, TetR family [Bacillota bacterium]